MTITDEEILEQLRELKNTAQTKQERDHSHAILLSNIGKSNNIMPLKSKTPIQ